MTNYNERLDKILFKVTGSKGLNIRDSITGDRRAEAKQALTSLIKELVAEAKPEKLNDELNYSTYGEGHDTAIDQFEQNLLKALEEV